MNNLTAYLQSRGYTLGRKLGEGTFGEVYEVWKRPCGIAKAVKLLFNAANSKAGKREQRALDFIKNLRHPYLVRTEHYEVVDNQLVIEMELADENLSDRLAYWQKLGKPGVPVSELLGYIREAADGLDFLHRQKPKAILHRDVKPGNILLQSGHAKVTDFGLARDEVREKERTVAGTPAFMPYEAWQGSPCPASDQYALAATYAMLRQGRSALRAAPVDERMASQPAGAFEFDSLIPEAEQSVLRKAMSFYPVDRFPSCVAFVEALAGAVGVPLNPSSGLTPVVSTHPRGRVEKFLAALRGFFW